MLERVVYTMTITSARMIGAVTRFRRPWQAPHHLSSPLPHSLRPHESYDCDRRQTTLHQHCRGSSDEWVLNTRTRGLMTKDNDDNHVNHNDRHVDSRTSIASALPYTATTTHANRVTSIMCSTPHALTPRITATSRPGALVRLRKRDAENSVLLVRFYRKGSRPLTTTPSF